MDCHFIKRVTRISMQAWNIPFYNTTISDLLEDLPRKNVTCVTCYFPVFVWQNDITLLFVCDSFAARTPETFNTRRNISYFNALCYLAPSKFDN